MFIKQNGKLYIHRTKYKIVGVNITPTSIEKVPKSETTLGEVYSVLTLEEVYNKYQINDGNSYLFNGTPKEDKKDEPINKS